MKYLRLFEIKDNVPLLCIKINKQLVLSFAKDKFTVGKIYKAVIPNDAIAMVTDDNKFPQRLDKPRNEKETVEYDYAWTIGNDIGAFFLKNITWEEYKKRMVTQQFDL